MKRLLFVSHKPVFGGPENQALRLAVPLERRGWETIVAITDEWGTSVPRLRAAGVELVCLRLHRLRSELRENLRTLAWFPAEVGNLSALMRRFAVDLVIVPGLENPHGAVAARVRGRPVVWQILGSRTPMAVRQTMLCAVRIGADAVMITGTTLVKEHPGLEQLGSRLIPFFPPVDTKLFSPDAARRAAARHRLNIADDEIVIGSIANLNAQKDHLMFVRAAAEVRKRRPQCRTRFVIVGETSATQRDYVAAVWKEAGRLGLEPGRDVIHVEPGERVLEFGSVLDVFWLSSETRSEGVPTAMLEAMSLETPVVATRVGGVADVIEDGQTGFLVNAKDFDAMAERTVCLLDDMLRRKLYGKNGRRWVLRDASLDACAETHLRAFEVAAEHHAGRRQRPPVQRARSNR